MCYEVNNNGKTLKVALETAMNHLPTMNKYFTIPTTLSAGAAAAKRPQLADGQAPARRTPDGLQAEVPPPRSIQEAGEERAGGAKAGARAIPAQGGNQVDLERHRTED